MRVGIWIELIEKSKDILSARGLLLARLSILALSLMLSNKDSPLKNEPDFSFYLGIGWLSIWFEKFFGWEALIWILFHK